MRAGRGGMVVSDRQVLKLMAELSKNTPKGIAALRAGMDRGTARKYAKLGELPSARSAPERHYRTRPDPFAWPLTASKSK